MQVFRFSLLLVLLWLVAGSHDLCARDLNSRKVDTRELTVLVTPLPPYVMQGARRGIACDIIERALASEGVKVKFSFTNYRRMELEVPQGMADGAFAGIPVDNPKVYFSDPVIEFKNVVVSLSDQQFTIKNLADLSGKRVISFRHATRILGKDFAEAIKNAASYFEVADQHSQLPMLDAQRGNITVLDYRAFIYYAQNLHGKELWQNLYKQYPIFKPVIGQMAFHKIETRDQFNRGLKNILQSGEYATIINQYLDN